MRRHLGAGEQARLGAQEADETLHGGALFGWQVLMGAHRDRGRDRGVNGHDVHGAAGSQQRASWPPWQVVDADARSTHAPHSLPQSRKLEIGGDQARFPWIHVLPVNGHGDGYAPYMQLLNGMRGGSISEDCELVSTKDVVRHILGRDLLSVACA